MIALPVRMILPWCAALALFAPHVHAQSYAWRYEGGAGDGSSRAEYLADLRGNSAAIRSTGGAGDGYTAGDPGLRGLDGSDGAVRHAGGTGDGYAGGSEFASYLSGGTIAARFTGGPGDGAALLSSDPLNPSGETLLARFTGGAGDGAALLSSDPLNAAGEPQFARVRGGTADGGAAGSVITSDLAGNDTTNRYAGGSGDGAASLHATSFDLGGSSAAAKMNGGPGDGAAMNNTTHSDPDGNSHAARTRGGSGDGYGAAVSAPSAGNAPVARAAVFLQGPFLSTVMSTWLSTGNTLPLSQPYNKAPWNYIGGDTVVSIPSGGIVDWILLELRDAAVPSTLIEQRAAFLKSNGVVVNLQGDSTITFPHSPAGSYHLVIRHRNHLPVMSVSPLLFSSLGAPSVDFRFTDTTAYGTNSLKSIGTGRFAMYAGDGNASGSITISDRNSVWRPQNGTSGYLNGDFNMTGSVTITDRNSYWRPNNGVSTSVP